MVGWRPLLIPETAISRKVMADPASKSHRASQCVPPQEELEDEIKNREAAHARLALVEQSIPKLHADLKKLQEQLVQSRMEVRYLSQGFFLLLELGAPHRTE